MLKRLFIGSCALLVVLLTAYSTACYTHPLLSGWLTGSVQNLGKPINASIYTDGKICNDIRIYNSVYKHSYWLALKQFDKDGMLQYINIDLNDKLIGRSVCTNKDCFEVINGSLFQSEVGVNFIDFKNDMKGFNFDPKLAFDHNSITFNVPPGWLRFNSIKIILNSPR